MQNINSHSLLTVKQFSEKHPAFSESSLRWMLFQANSDTKDQKTNSYAGLKKAIRRIGRRVLIDENCFFEWVGKQGGASQCN